MEGLSQRAGSGTPTVATSADVTSACLRLSTDAGDRMDGYRGELSFHTSTHKENSSSEQNARRHEIRKFTAHAAVTEGLQPASWGVRMQRVQRFGVVLVLYWYKQ